MGAPAGEQPRQGPPRECPGVPFSTCCFRRCHLLQNPAESCDSSFKMQLACWFRVQDQVYCLQREAKDKKSMTVLPVSVSMDRLTVSGDHFSFILLSTSAKSEMGRMKLRKHHCALQAVDSSQGTCPSSDSAAPLPPALLPRHQEGNTHPRWARQPPLHPGAWPWAALLGLGTLSSLDAGSHVPTGHRWGRSQPLRGKARLVC